MGDIGARQARYEVLPTATQPERAEPWVDEAVPEPARHDHERVAARAEPALG